MTKRTRMTGEERRERILEAALELFAEKGYAGSTTRELASRAGITEPVIYRYFRGKEDVMRAVFERYSFLPQLREFALGSAQGNLRDQFAELAGKWRAFMRQRSLLVRLVLSEMQHNPEMARLFHETVNEGMRLAAQALQARALSRGYDPEAMETAVRLFFSSMVAHFLLEGPAFLEENPRTDAVVDRMVTLLADGLEHSRERAAAA